MRNRILRGAVSLLLAAAACLACTAAHASRQQRGIADKLIRLHIIAESDSDADQRLKLLVRDRLLDEGLCLTGSADAAEAAKTLGSRLDEISAAAGDELRRNGCESSVTVTLGRELYPMREYGDVRLPAGEYTSLRVVIGDGEGQNWWCVMFPPLCSGLSRSDTAIVLDEGERKFIAPNASSGVRLRFWLLDLIARWRK